MMPSRCKRPSRMLLLLIAMLWLSTSPATAEEKAAAPAPAPAAGGGDELEKPIGIGFSLDYTLVTDYIWRGANFSEFAGEGREKLNHQVGAGVSLDLDEKLGLPSNLGTVGFSWWGEWYAANKSDRFNGVPNTSDSHLQEADWTINWCYDVGDTGVSVEAGWIAYEFPNLAHDGYTSYEWYGSIGFNDAKILGLDNIKGLEDGIVSPSVTYNYDYDVVKGGWLEIAFSHGFSFDTEAAVLKDLTVTPSVAFGIDNRYWDKALGTTHKSTRLANILYGLEFGYDLSSALGIPARYGALSLTAFVNFSDALRDSYTGARPIDPLDDEFFGGVTLGYEW